MKSATFEPTLNSLKTVLNRLHKLTKDLKPKVVHHIDVKYHVRDLEDANEYIEASEYLNDEGIIEEITYHPSGEEEIETDYSKKYEGKEKVQFVHLEYIIKPEVLNNFMIQSSMLPKYSLNLDKQGRLVLNDKYLLGKLQDNGVNYYFMKYALQNPGKVIKRADLIETAGRDIEGKRFHTTIGQIIKNSELRKVFFIDVTQDSLIFRNKLKEKDLEGESIDQDKIKKFLKDPKFVKSI